MLPEPLAIMGVDVVPFDSYDHALHCVENRIAAGEKTFCVAVNPEKIHRASQDSDLRKILDRADMKICDGIGVALAARLLHQRRIKRCTGVDLFLNLVRQASEKGWKIFLLGASPESNEQACRVLQQQHPELKVVGRRDGFFRENSEIVEQINTVEPDLLFVAMGSPRQEFWISENIHALNVRFCMGVGGTFDVISGKTKRAPRFFRRTGTEFLYRLLSEPGRWRRQAILPLFLLSLLKMSVVGLAGAANQNDVKTSDERRR